MINRKNSASGGRRRFSVQAYGVMAEVERRNVKCIRLYIKPPDGRIFISLPQSCGDQAAADFIRDKLDWINEKQKQYRLSDKSAENRYCDGCDIILFGKKLVLRIVQSAKQSYQLGEDTLTLFVRDMSQAAVESRIDNAYRRELALALAGLVPVWEQRAGAAANVWRLRRMKTRWGTCNTDKKRIWLNLRLAALDIKYTEYVIAHELCHLHEPSHNARFKGLLDSCLPGWRALKRELDAQSHILY